MWSPPPRCAAECSKPALTADWTVGIPGLDFTVASVVAHAAAGPLWYALDLWSEFGGDDAGAFEIGVRADAPNDRLLTGLTSAARVYGASVDLAPPATRGYHPAGAPDPSGFAAMACDEILVHGDDAARGLGLRLVPDPDLALRVLARLFPWHSAVGDPWEGLLWANGRMELPGRPSQRRWLWHCAPLAEWDGKDPGLGV